MTAATALNWIRKRATSVTTEEFEVNGTMVSTDSFSFHGTVPARMRRDLIGSLDLLENLEGDALTGTREHLSIGAGGRRSDQNKIEYSRTVYTAAA
jgi:hypothetical protein